MKYLGLDVGTTKLKCGVFDDSGNMIFFDSVDYNENRIENDSYIDIDTIKDSVFILLEKAYRETSFDSIVVSSLGESFVLLDNKDKIIFYPMLYTDARGEDEANNFKNYGEEIFQISGVFPQSMYSVYKLLWIKNNHPDVYKKAKKLFLVNEYITYLLTGKRAVDYSQAARTGLFDIKNKCFSEKLCNLFGVDISLFSNPVKSGHYIGCVKKEFSLKWKTNKTIYVLSGGHDQVCSAIGAGVIDETSCVDGMGTVECMVTLFNKPIIDTFIGSEGYPYVPFLDKYCSYLLNYSCGSLVRWWLESIYKREDVLNGKAFKDIENDFLNKPTGIFVLPYFGGAATPYQNIDAKGAFLNLSLKDSPSRIYQAILEGLSFEMKLNLDIVKKIGVNPKAIIATGGGSNSKKWLQIKADILGKKVFPLKIKEAGILGCAILGASYLNKKPYEYFTKKFVRLEKPILPRKEQKELYNIEYKKYKKIYNSIKKFF